MAKAAKEQNRFVVDLGGVPLGADDRRQVAAAIQGAVLSFLAVNTKMPVGKVELIADIGTMGMTIDPDDNEVPAPRRKG